MIFPKRKVIIFGMAFLFGLGFLISFLGHEPRIQFAGHKIYCNPRAKIDLGKSYHLHLWDYQWPYKGGAGNYLSYLKKAVAEFNKIYPNIKVEITLLDLLTGPNQLAKAIQSNNAPDVYCSAGEIPTFSFNGQIPVGLYLKPAEKEVYLANIYQFLCYENQLCSFPRWISPGFWIGNEKLLKEAGLSVTKIQSQGWTWQEFASATSKIPVAKYLLVGSMGANGFFTQLLANSSDRETANQEPGSCTVQELGQTINYLESLIKLKKIPPDCEQNMLKRFLLGQAMILAGVKPTLFHFIEEQLSLHPVDWRPVLLPVPVLNSGKDVLMVENNVLCIYRNKYTAGPDHLTAAVRLGQFLSCYPQTDPSDWMMAVPATKSGLENWLLRNNTNVEVYRKLGQKKLSRTWFPVSEYFDKVYPVIKDVISSKLSGEDAKQRLKY